MSRGPDYPDEDAKCHENGHLIVVDSHKSVPNKKGEALRISYISDDLPVQTWASGVPICKNFATLSYRSYGRLLAQRQSY